MVNAVARGIGVAMGLEPVCPQNNTKLLEPTLSDQYIGPQLDDVRGMHALYGDYLENDDTLTLDTADGATQLFTDSSPSEALVGVEQSFQGLSLDDFNDTDNFAVIIAGEGEVNFDLQVEVEPTSFGNLSQYPMFDDLVSCIAGSGTTFPFIIRDLRVTVFDSDLNIVFGPVDENPVGAGEAFTVNLTQAGTYFVSVAGGGGNADPNEVQQYRARFALGNQLADLGGFPGPLVRELGPVGIGASAILDAPPEAGGPFTGRRATLGMIDGQHPSAGHDATRDLNNRVRNHVRLDFPFTIFGPGSVGGASDHATAALGLAAGNPLGIDPDSLFPPAYEASIITASAAVRTFPSGFLPGREALAILVFAMTDPVIAAQFSAGVNPDLDPNSLATVVLAPFGTPNDLRGDSFTSHVFDAMTSMTGVPYVASAGNEGTIDEVPTCGGQGGNVVRGGLFQGYRTINSPASGFNGITVGSVSKFVTADDVDPTLIDTRNEDFGLAPLEGSKGPADTFVYDGNSGQTNFGDRVGLHVIAPGSAFVLLDENPLQEDPPGDLCEDYVGHTTVLGLALPSVGESADPDAPDDTELFASASGTSFSASVAAGAIALLQDAALADIELGLLPDHAIEAPVIKAVIMNSAAKIIGWTNNGGNPGQPQNNREGQDLESDTIRTRTTGLSLDPYQGAGIINLKRAYETLVAGYLDVTFGPHTRDVAATEADIPHITTPPTELPRTDVLPFPGAIAASDTAGSVESSYTMTRRLLIARNGMNAPGVAFSHQDTGDPDVGQSNPPKSGRDTDFTPRVPFKLSPNNQFQPPSGPGIAPQPVDVLPENEISGAIPVGPIGWDVATVGTRILNMPPSPDGTITGPTRGGYIDYFIAYPFQNSVDRVDVTLTWLRHVTIEPLDFSDPAVPIVGDVTELELENLDLEFLQADALGNILGDNLSLQDINEGGPRYAASQSGSSNIEHISLAPPTGFYVVRVRWINQVYDAFRNQPPGDVQYALAWRIQPAFAPDPVDDIQGPQAFLVSERAYEESPLMRVFEGAVRAFGTYRGHPDFDWAYDVSGDGYVGLRDLQQIISFWSSR